VRAILRANREVEKVTGFSEEELKGVVEAGLLTGQAVTGPALIEDEWSTTLVYPGQRCQADRLGNLLIDQVSS